MRAGVLATLTLPHALPAGGQAGLLLRASRRARCRTCSCASCCGWAASGRPARRRARSCRRSGLPCSSSSTSRSPSLAQVVGGGAAGDAAADDDDAGVGRAVSWKLPRVAWPASLSDDRPRMQPASTHGHAQHDAVHAMSAAFGIRPKPSFSQTACSADQRGEQLPGGMRPALRSAPRQLRQQRPALARIHLAQPEQQDPGHPGSAGPRRASRWRCLKAASS